MVLPLGGNRNLDGCKFPLQVIRHGIAQSGQQEPPLPVFESVSNLFHCLCEYPVVQVVGGEAEPV